MKSEYMIRRLSTNNRAVLKNTRNSFTDKWTALTSWRSPGWDKAYWGIILFGIFLRTSQFLFNRSLWYDEAALALNVTRRSYAELLKPLDYHQGAPPGFLYASRYLIDLFGNHDYVLRLIPFLAGIASLILFFLLTKRFLNGPFLAFALLLFSINDNLIYYSSEYKQYSSDVFIVLFLLFIALAWSADLSTYRSALILALIGGVAIWFSHPAIFVISGIGLYSSALIVIKKSWNNIPKLSLVAVVWLLSIAALYLLSLSHLGQNQELSRYWNSYFIPFPIVDIGEFAGNLNQLLWRFIRDPGALHYPRLVIIILAIGSFQLLRTSRKIFWLLLATVPFLFIASSQKLYPIGGRLMLFAVPILIIVISKGLELTGRINSRLTLALTLIVAAALLIRPLDTAITHLVSPRTGGELRTVMESMQEELRAGDTIYVYHGSRFAYNYYAHEFVYYGSQHSFDYYDQEETLEPYHTYYGVLSRDNQIKYLQQIDTLRGKDRVWLIFTHVYDGALGSEEEFIMNYVNRLGERQLSFEAPGASAHLFDFSKRIKISAREN